MTRARPGRGQANRSPSSSDQPVARRHNETGRPGQRPEEASTGLKQAWGHLSRKSKAVVVALVAILGGWSTIKEQAVDPLVGLYTNRQPGKDEAALAELRAGMSFSSFQEALKQKSIAVLGDSIRLTEDSSLPVRDELIILPTAYVEAFVDASQKVVAYTVTARGDKWPVVKLPGGPVHLGSTRVADSPIAHAGIINRVAGHCGNQTVAYYEIGGGSHVDLFQTFAYGNTTAGSLPSGDPGSSCPPNSMLGLERASELSAETDDGRYVIETYTAPDTYLASERAYRSSLVINSVTVTAPEVPLVPEMISLSSDTLGNLDPGD